MTLTLQGRFIYGLTQTRWYQNRCSTFNIKDFIVEKNGLENFGILTPGDLNFDLSQKNDQNDFEMIFRELSKAAFRFSLRRPGAEIIGGVQTPPPPHSRRWKIQRPSRARVTGGGKCQMVNTGEAFTTTGEAIASPVNMLKYALLLVRNRETDVCPVGRQLCGILFLI